MWYLDTDDLTVPRPVLADVHYENRKQGEATQLPYHTTTDEASGLKAFCERTTIHGIPYFASINQPLTGRIVWLCLFALSFASCCFTLYPPFMSWKQGDIRTAVLLETKDNIPFPAITFCSINQFRRSIVGANPINAATVVAGFGWQPADAISICNSSANASNFLVNFDFVTSLSNPLGRFFTGMDSFQSVLTCVHQGQDCSKNILNDFTEIGICFTYNPGQQYRSQTTTFVADEANLTYPSVIGQPIITHSSGPTTALEIVLNAQQGESCDSGGKSEGDAGFHMMIHHPDVDALWLVDGSIKLKPGTRTELQIGQKAFERSTEYLGKCAADVLLEYYQKSETYQQTSCYKECLTKHVKDECDCLPYYMPKEALAQAVELRRETPAALQNLQLVCLVGIQIACSRNAEKDFARNVSALCSQCKKPCQENMYNVEQISTSTFPAENVALRYLNRKYADFTNPQPMWEHLVNDSVFQNFRTEYNAHFSMSGPFASTNEVRDNILAVKVYMKSMTVEVISEDPLTAAADLAIQLGGATGLFLGASMLSFIEIIYFCCAWSSNLWKQRNVQRKVSNSKGAFNDLYVMHG